MLELGRRRWSSDGPIADLNPGTLLAVPVWFGFSFDGVRRVFGCKDVGLRASREALAALDPIVRVVERGGDIVPGILEKYDLMGEEGPGRPDLPFPDGLLLIRRAEDVGVDDDDSPVRLAILASSVGGSLARGVVPYLRESCDDSIGGGLENSSIKIGVDWEPSIPVF